MEAFASNTKPARPNHVPATSIGWAMTRAPIALVAALRETSVLFAALLVDHYVL